jgi:hypothetical protein
MSVYRITPLEKKSVYYAAEMFRDNDNGTTSWFNVEDHYRWGQGFIEEDMAINLPRVEDTKVYCNPNAGWGAELDDQIAVFFEFSDDIKEEEQELIKQSYYDGGVGWLHEGDHTWEFEDDSIIVLSPFKIDFCDDNGTVLIENVPPKT